MATTSALKVMHDLHNLTNDPPNGWSTTECAVEIINNALTAETAGNATAANQATEITALALLHTDLAALPSAANASTTVATTAQGTKAVTTANTPVRLVASTTKVESVVIQAFKGVATANTGNIYVGFSATGGSNLMVLTPGQSVTFEAPAGKKIDLTNIYIDAVTNLDAVQYTSIA